MSGKTENKTNIELNYKESLEDKFVDVSNLKSSEESTSFITRLITNLRNLNLSKIKKIEPVYLPSTKPGAKSPLSVEGAQKMINTSMMNIEDAIKTESTRAISSEMYISDFIKTNMVSKSEDQEITGLKEFDSVKIKHSNTDTEKVDEASINNLFIKEDPASDEYTNIIDSLATIDQGSW